MRTSGGMPGALDWGDPMVFGRRLDWTWAPGDYQNGGPWVPANERYGSYGDSQFGVYKNKKGLKYDKRLDQDFSNFNRANWEDFVRSRRVVDAVERMDTPGYFDDVRARAAQYGDSAAATSTGAALRALDRADAESTPTLASAKQRLGLAGVASKVDALNTAQKSALENRDAARDLLTDYRSQMDDVSGQSFANLLKLKAERLNRGKKKSNQGTSDILSGIGSLAGIYFGGGFG